MHDVSVNDDSLNEEEEGASGVGSTSITLSPEISSSNMRRRVDAEISLFLCAEIDEGPQLVIGGSWSIGISISGVGSI